MAQHFVMVQFCARVIAPGTQASVRPKQPKRTRRQLPARVRTATRGQQPAWAPVVACQQLQPLAPLAQDAKLATLNILNTLRILMSLRTLSQLTGHGQAGAGGESAARAVAREGPGQGFASAPRLQLEGGHVKDQRPRERPVSKNLAQVGPND